MKAGRYRKENQSRPFVLDAHQRALDWQDLARGPVPAPLRQALELALERQNNETFCAALPRLEELLRTAPAWLTEIPAQTLPAQLLPPVDPRTFICIGLNYRDHAIESGAELPKAPLLFSKSANAITGHGHAVPLPPASTQTDYEAEFAVVIGRTASNISEDKALDYVAGYTCCNDVSARDFQFADGQWYRGKSADGFGPIGPWLVTPSTIADPHALRIQLRLNGQTLQDSNTAQLIFRIPRLISYISASITLQPGDVITTGTPPGVGFARKPPVYLKPGDHMEVEIEHIGVLANPVVAR